MVKGLLYRGQGCYDIIMILLNGTRQQLNTTKESACQLNTNTLSLPPHTAAPLKPILPDLDTIEDGLIFRQCVRDRVINPLARNQQILASEDEGEGLEGREVQQLLEGFSEKEKRKILRYEASTPYQTKLYAEACI